MENQTLYFRGANTLCVVLRAGYIFFYLAYLVSFRRETFAISEVSQGALNGPKWHANWIFTPTHYHRRVLSILVPLRGRRSGHQWGYAEVCSLDICSFPYNLLLLFFLIPILYSD